jgi:hypothetical protein
MSPCIMYWPDNEPFPEQGQIRPSNLAGMPVGSLRLICGTMTEYMASSPPFSIPVTEGPYPM